MVPEAGLEPARPERAEDFKSPVSTIPPLRHKTPCSLTKLIGKVNTPGVERGASYIKRILQSKHFINSHILKL